MLVQMLFVYVFKSYLRKINYRTVWISDITDKWVIRNIIFFEKTWMDHPVNIFFIGLIIIVFNIFALFIYLY